jgi:hypothetical protein
MVSHEGDPGAQKPFLIPILAGAQAHTTKYGGWQRYLVLAPDNESSAGDWYLGWRWPSSQAKFGIPIPGGAGVSRIPTSGPKRVLIGPGFAEWFGIRADTNEQIPIMQIGDGCIGNGGEHKDVPLF